MSQVRGRIKTVVNYDDRITNEGTCCESDGTKSVKTLSACSRSGGRWVPVLPPESVTCPQLSEKGCCCSCAYTTKNTGTPEDWTHPDHAEGIIGGKYSSRDGTRNNVSRCECDYNGGNFLAGDCPETGPSIATLCETNGVEGRNDVRWPFSCCHCDTDADGYLFRNCSNVCNSRECLELSEAHSDNPDCASEFDSFKICDYETYFGGSPKECADIVIPGCTDPTATNYNPGANSDDGSCEYVILGCTDPSAINFNPLATEDNGSCEYGPEPPGPTGPTGPTGPGPTGGDPVGACCSNDLNSWPYDPDNYPGDFQRCTEKTKSECELSLGTWQGEGTDCSEPFICDCFFPFEDIWEGEADLDGDGFIDPVVGGILWRDCNNQCTPEGPSVRSATYGSIQVEKDTNAPVSRCGYNYWDQAETRATVNFDAKYFQGEDVLGYEKAVECRTICAEGETHPKWIEATNTVECDHAVPLNFLSFREKSVSNPNQFGDCLESRYVELNTKSGLDRTKFINTLIDVHPDTKSLLSATHTGTGRFQTLAERVFFREPPEGDDKTVPTPSPGSLPEPPYFDVVNGRPVTYGLWSVYPFSLGYWHPTPEHWWRANNTVYVKWTEPIMDPTFVIYPYQNPFYYVNTLNPPQPNKITCENVFIDVIADVYSVDYESDFNTLQLFPETRNWYYNGLSTPSPYQYPYLQGSLESMGIPAFFDNEIVTTYPSSSYIQPSAHMQRYFPIPPAFSPYTKIHIFPDEINRGNYNGSVFDGLLNDTFGYCRYCSDFGEPLQPCEGYTESFTDDDQLYLTEYYQSSNGRYEGVGFYDNYLIRPDDISSPAAVENNSWLQSGNVRSRSLRSRRHQLDTQYYSGPAVKSVWDPNGDDPGCPFTVPCGSGAYDSSCAPFPTRSGRWRRDASGGWCGGCLNGKSAIPLRIYEPCRITGTMGYKVDSRPGPDDSYGPKNWKAASINTGPATYEDIKPRTLKCWKKCMEPNSLLNSGKLSNNFESFMDTDPLDTDLDNGYNFVYEPDPNNSNYNFKLHAWCGKPPTDDDGGDSLTFGGFNSVLKQFRNYRVTKVGYDPDLCNIFPEQHQNYGIYAPFYNYNPLFISMITDGPAKPGFHIGGYYPASYFSSRTHPNQGGTWFQHSGEILNEGSPNSIQWWNQLGFTDPTQSWNMDVNIYVQNGDNSLYENHRFDWFGNTTPTVPGKRPKSMCLDSDFYPRTYTTEWYRHLPNSLSPDTPYRNSPGSPFFGGGNFLNSTLIEQEFYQRTFCNPFAPITPPPKPDENYTNPDAGACCIYDRRENKFKCEYKGRGSCENQNGFFSLDKDGNAKNCRYVSCPKAPVVSGGFANPPSIQESELPEVGELFAGGIYLGVFDPKTSLTRSKLGTGQSVRATTTSPIGTGNKFRKWALIAAPADIGQELGGDTPLQVSFQANSENIREFNSSTFDGHYNTFGDGEDILIPKTDLLNKVREYYLFNFRDWYVPSIQELGFAIHQQKDIDIGTFKRRISESRSKLKISQPYLSSTTKIREKTNETEKYPTANLVYQILTEDNINSRVFTTLASRTAPANVRLFRRIYIEE